jgi:hypothetical protein
MSVENKIKQLLSRANGTEQLTEATLEEASETVVADGKPTVNTAKDNSKAGQGSGQGDTSMPMQGSSKKADSEEVMDATGKNSAAAKATKETNPLPMKGDAKSVKTQANEESDEEGETITDAETVDIKSQLDSILVKIFPKNSEQKLLLFSKPPLSLVLTTRWRRSLLS